MRRLALVASSKVTNWKSCQSIERNIISSYEMSFSGETKVFFQSLDPLENWQTARSIRKFGADRIVFVSHKPHPLNMLLALIELDALNAPIYFHLYGDFILYPDEWSLAADLLWQHSVGFIVASQRQAQLVKNLFDWPPSVEVAPYPIDTDVFKFDPNHQDEQRPLTVLYTGRISLQKNVIPTIERTLEWAKLRKQEIRFLLAGWFDDLGAPYFGVPSVRGQYYQEFADKMRCWGPAVKYCGNLNAAQLSALYNSADLFVSLSTFQDEEFGMAPAEALCTGLPAILSNWAGYESFSKAGASLVPIRLTPKGHAIDFESYFDALDAFAADYSKLKLPKQRAQLAHVNQRQFSIENTARLLRRIHQGKPNAFKGFNPRLEAFKNRFKTGVPFPEGPRPNSLYEEIYGSYFEI